MGQSTPDAPVMALAANAQGELAAVLESCVGCATPVPVLVVRAAGAAVFGAPQPLMPSPSGNTQADVGSVSVTVDAAGGVLAAWTAWTGTQPVEGPLTRRPAAAAAAGTSGASKWGVYARLLPVGGALTPSVRLGDANYDTVLATALDVQGRPTVAWETATLGDNVARDTPISVMAATAMRTEPSGPASFCSASVLVSWRMTA